ncbi:hypothetical protein FIS3754_26540 [Fischerella sp. NIES-3754]|nr:hypothetical protein FIS3754_26540 [Fischerella sp. NIES-3754]BCX09041.1 MAG: hypothetical protein KatS3mg066_2900 [Fischerella sp.]
MLRIFNKKILNIAISCRNLSPQIEDKELEVIEFCKAEQAGGELG